MKERYPNSREAGKREEQEYDGSVQDLMNTDRLCGHRF
jgi:hypothetical protein